MKNFDTYHFGKRKVIIRVDFNVPLNADLKITDNTRITSTIPTIKKILNDGGSVILMSHLGRPKQGPENKFSLKHLVQNLQEFLEKENLRYGVKVKFIDDCIGDKVKTEAKNLQVGEVLLLENLRFYKEEENGDVEFARKLSELADFYVNDAFGTAHRAHASTTIIAKYFSKENKSFGYLMEAEVNNAEKVLSNAIKPFTAIIGGAKVSDKILIIENLLTKANHLIIGGGMAYTFLKAMGVQVGNSLVEEDRLSLAIEIINKAKANNVQLLLPIDHHIANKFDNDAQKKQIDNNEGIEPGWMGLDIGPKTIVLFSKTIAQSKTILWNGPMGVFEMPFFEKGTKSVAEAIGDATKNNNAFSLIGGGDSVAAINKFHLNNSVSFISTGGGALLEVFEGKILPGIKAIRE